MFNKSVRIVVKDFIKELREENNRLESELSFALKSNTLLNEYRNCLTFFNHNCLCTRNIKNKLWFNKLEDQYKTVIINEKQTAFENRLKTKYSKNSIESQQISSFNSINTKINNNSTENCSQLTNNTTSQRSSTVYSTNDCLPENNEHFLCPKCNLSLTDDEELRKHQQKEHPMVPEFNFTCFLSGCHFATNSYSSFDKHQKIHQNKVNHSINSHSSQEQTHEKSAEKVSFCDIPKNSTETLSSIQKPSIPTKPIVDLFSCQFPKCVFNSNNLCLFQKHINDEHIRETINLCDNELNCKTCDQNLKTPIELICDNTPQVKLKSKSCLHFRCEFNGCEKAFENNQNLIEHIVKVHSNKHFKCKYCDYKSEKQSFIKIHERKTHENMSYGQNKVVLRKVELKFKCNYCCESFNRENHLIIHQNKRHKEYSYKCQICEYSSYNSVLYEKHEKLHTIEGKFICTFKGCDQVFHNRKECVKHLTCAHSIVDKGFLCNICLEYYKSEEILISHKILFHNSKVCDICEYTCEDWNDFQRHKSIHNKFKCNFCSFQTNHKHKYIEHKAKHSNETPFKCGFNGCEAHFKTTHRLKAHRRQLHTRALSFKCEWTACGKAFISFSQLKSHRLLHTGEKPFICDWPGCDSKFRIISLLKNHRNIHTKPFACDWAECGKCFSTGELLGMHINTHTGEKPFVCEWPGCDARYGYRGSKLTHQFTHTKPFKCESIGCDRTFPTKYDSYRHFKRMHKT